MKYGLRSIGSNGNYQLGCADDADRDQWTDTVQFAEQPHVVCGGNHTIALVGQRAYSCGDNRHGQCGAGPAAGDHVIGFQQVALGTQWTAASAGWEFSIFCNDRNEIWGCGAGPDGELGLGPGTRTAGKLTKIHGFDERVVAMESSLHHTVVQLANGDFYGWGNNKKQQLCAHDPDKSNRVVWSPTKLDVGSSEHFALGRDFSVFQSADRFTYLGRDRFHISQGLAALAGVQVLDMRSMWSSVHLLCRDASTGEKAIISMGNNSHGQLFQQQLNVDIAMYDVGSEHGVVCTQDGKVYAWGWGEHGNCGAHESGVARESHVTFDYLNDLKVAGDVIGVYGGCATTWVVLRVG